MHFNWEILPVDDHNQGIFPKIRWLFSNFQKGQERPCPLLPLVTWLTFLYKVRNVCNWKVSMLILQFFFFYRLILRCINTSQERVSHDVSHSVICCAIGHCSCYKQSQKKIMGHPAWKVSKYGVFWSIFTP